MFKKLRQKVEGAESPERDGSISPNLRRQSLPVRRQDAGKWRNVSGLQKNGSSTSLSGSEVEMPVESSSKEDLLTALMQRTTHVKRLEIKLADYGQSLKECTKQRDKLMSTLEKQQDTAMRRMSELEETYSEGKKKMELTISSLEKKERDLTETVENLRTENKKLKSSVDEWKEEKDEFERSREEFFAKRDNNEELQDLQKQELAKVKHMLMNSEKESKRLQESLDEKMADLMQCREVNDEMESSLRTTTESLDSIRKQLELQIEANEKVTSIYENQEEALFGAKKENNDLKDKMSTLFTELKKTRSSFSSLESAHSSVCEKYQGLKHSSEAIMTQAKVDLDQKESIIDHLKKNMSSLEKRMRTESLPENEQVQALITERSALENRLEESHQQLNNIKATWSTKINQLEQQVSHLNAKIAEDSEEITSRNQQFSTLEESTSKEIEKLKSKLQNLKHEYDMALKQNEIYLEQVTKLEANLIEQTAKFDLERAKGEHVTEKISNKAKSTEAKLREQIDQLHLDNNHVNEKIKIVEDELTKCQNEFSAKEEEKNSRIEQLETEIENKQVEISNRDRITEEMARALEETRHSRDTLREQCKITESSSKETNTRVEELEAKLKEIIKESSECSQVLEEARRDHSALKEEQEASLSRLKEASHQLQEKENRLATIENEQSASQSQVEEWNQEIKHLKTTLISREEELMHCKEEIADLRNDHAEESEEVSSLKAERTALEEKLAERDRSLKLQQQRMNDLKKALNKELNKRTPGQVNGNSVNSARKQKDQGTIGIDQVPVLNGAEENEPDIAIIGTTSIDDPSLSYEQREITVKYLKHVILTFLSCSQSEAQQLIKAMSMLLNFNRDEEKFLKEMLEYKSSWFGTKPSTKKVVKQGRR